MKRDRIIAFRATATDEERVTEIARLTGGTISGVIRELINSAELRPSETLRPFAQLTKNDAGYVLQDTGIAR